MFVLSKAVYYTKIYGKSSPKLRAVSALFCKMYRNARDAWRILPNTGWLVPNPSSGLMSHSWGIM